MDLETALPIVERIADAVGGSVYRHYSGRGMYGAQCIGIDCDDLRGAATDSLGGS